MKINNQIPYYYYFNISFKFILNLNLCAFHFNGVRLQLLNCYPNTVSCQSNSTQLLASLLT